MAVATDIALARTNESMAVASAIALSFTAKIWVDSFKMPMAMTIQAEHPLNSKQITYLKLPEEDTTYAQKAQDAINCILTPALLKESDELCALPTGQKLALFGW